MLIVQLMRQITIDDLVKSLNETAQ